MLSKQVNIRKIMITVATVLSLAAISYYYFIVTIPRKESELNQRGFRILSRMDQNIREKRNNVLVTLDEIFSHQPGYSQKQESYEGLDTYLPIRMKDYDDKYNSAQVLPLYNEYKNKWEINFFGDYRHGNTTSKDTVIRYPFDADKFFLDLTQYRKDFFEDYIIIYNKSIIFQTKDFAYGSNDPTEKSELHSDFIREDTLAGRAYYVFYHTIAGDADTEFTLCGLISQASYAQSKYALAPDHAIWLTLAFLFLLVLIPFIKLIMVSPLERIQYGDIIRMGVSLVCGGAIITTAFLTWIVSIAEMNRQSNMLKNVNDKIAQRILTELNEISTEVMRQETNFSDLSYSVWLGKNAKDNLTRNAQNLDQYFNSALAAHHTESLQLIDDTLGMWAIWLDKCELYPDLRLEDESYPSLNPNNKEHRFYPQLDTGDHEENFGFQAVRSWSARRNGVLVSKRANDSTHAIITKAVIESFTQQELTALQQHLDGKISIPWSLMQKMKSLAFIGLETKLYSITEVAMPDEMQFAVLDAKGDVLFHSDSKRNLRENFIQECNKQPLVREVIRSRMDTTLRVYYFGRNYQANFSALAGLPLTVVTLYDSSSHLECLLNEATFTLIMLLILSLVIASIFILTLILTRRPKLLRRQNVNLKWVRLTPLNKEACKLLTGMLLLFALVGIGLSFFMIDRLFLAFSIPLLTLATTASRLYTSHRARYIKSLYSSFIKGQFQTFISLCLSVQAINFIILLSGKGNLSEMSPTIAIGVISLGFLFYLALKPDATFRWNIILLIERVCKVICRKKNNIRDGPTPPVMRGTGYIVASMILLVINISILPTVIFFYTASELELHAVEKRSSIQLANGIQKRQEWLMSSCPDFISTHDSLKPPVITAGIYSLSTIQDDVQLLNRKKIDSVFAEMTDDESEQDRFMLSWELYSQVVNLFNLHWNSLEARDIFAHRNSSDDSTQRWVWYRHPVPAGDRNSWYLVYYYPDEFPSEAFAGALIKLDMFHDHFKSISGRRWAVFAILVLTFALVVSRVLFFTYKKITLLDYFNFETVSKVKEADKALIKNLINKNESSNVIVISLPGTDVIATLIADIEGTPINSTTLSNTDPLARFASQQQSFKTTNGHTITIFPFLDIAELDNLPESLASLAKLFQDTTRKVIWITSVDPKEQVEILGRKIIAFARQKKSDTGNTEIIQIRKSREILLRILDDFTKVSYRLEDNLRGRDIGKLYAHVEEEFRFGAYFRKLRESIMTTGVIDGYYHLTPAQKPDNEQAVPKHQHPELERLTTTVETETAVAPGELPITDQNTAHANKKYSMTVAGETAEPEISRNIDEHSDDMFVLKIQDVAQNYYYSIWATLTNKEKYVLYDLAQDDLTNYKNYSILVDLERKGILYFDERENALKIFNKSFRNFILTVIDPGDALMLKNDIDTDGTWETIRTIFIIFVLGAGAFLLITENQFYNKIVVVIGAVAALIPAVVNFFHTTIKTIRAKSEAS